MSRITVEVGEGRSRMTVVKIYRDDDPTPEEAERHAEALLRFAGGAARLLALADESLRRKTEGSARALRDEPQRR